MSLRNIFHNAGIRRYLHMEKYVLIPAYCPDVRLPEFVRKLHEEGLHVLIADDGSPAEYTQVFDACAEYAVILHHSENQGKGAALKTMIRWLGANTETEYAAVTADADGQHDISDIIHCVNTAASDHASLVLGVRDFNSKTSLSAAEPETAAPRQSFTSSPAASSAIRRRDSEPSTARSAMIFLRQRATTMNMR